MCCEGRNAGGGTASNRVNRRFIGGAEMSEERVTLEFLAHQIRSIRDDVLSLKDDMAVLTAMVVRHDQEFSRLNAKLDDMFNQMRAMVR
jgi:hypothetical protein